jgi:hypothetical protein
VPGPFGSLKGADPYGLCTTHGDHDDDGNLQGSSEGCSVHDVAKQASRDSQATEDALGGHTPFRAVADLFFGEDGDRAGAPASASASATAGSRENGIFVGRSENIAPRGHTSLQSDAASGAGQEEADKRDGAGPGLSTAEPGEAKSGDRRAVAETANAGSGDAGDVAAADVAAGNLSNGGRAESGAEAEERGGSPGVRSASKEQNGPATETSRRAPGASDARKSGIFGP